jgi:hypothetical protein
VFGVGLEWKCKKPPMESEDPMEAVIGAISCASSHHTFSRREMLMLSGKNHFAWGG